MECGIQIELGFPKFELGSSACTQKSYLMAKFMNGLFKAVVQGLKCYFVLNLIQKPFQTNTQD